MTGDGYITGSEMGMYLADNVVNYTRRRQHPQYGKINNPDLDQGDFIFVPLKTLKKRAKQEKLKEEKEDLARDIEKLRAEREESRKLFDEMKRLLQAQLQAGERDLSEKKTLERQVALLAREAEKRKALEQELEMLNREREKTARQTLAPKALAKEKPKALVSAPPREIKTAKQPVKKETPSRKKVKTARANPPDSIKKIIRKPVTKTLKTIPRKEQKIASLHVPEPKPQQDLSTLIVTSNVINAKIYIDKKEISFWASPDEAWIYRGEAPFQSQEITPGRHVIRVHEDGYEEEVKVVHIDPGETLELDVTLFRVLSETGDEDAGGGGGGGPRGRNGRIIRNLIHQIALDPPTLRVR